VRIQEAKELNVFCIQYKTLIWNDEMNSEKYILRYNQQDGTCYNNLLLFSLLYMFQAVFSPIIRSS